MKRALLIIITCLLSCNAFSENSFEDWYQKLSDKEKVAQVFITGVQSKKLKSFEKSLFKEWPVGGLIYFKRNYSNPDQFLSLQKELHQINSLSPFSFTDQEGGDVVRIGSPYDSPTPLAVGELNSKKVTQYLGRAYGSLLADLDISSNLAPVVDVRSKNSLDFISTRSFSSDPHVVAEVSLALSEGMLKGGVLPTLKHFPGLGGIESDSHKTLGMKKTSLDQAQNHDWLPYKVHAQKNLPFFVMTSHTQLILDDKDYGVVTYSKPALELLRKITSPSQIAITDDLEMRGAKIKSSFPEAALKSFMAGHDLILIGWSGKKLSDSLKHFKNQIGNQNFDSRLKESLKRIYSLKERSKKIVVSASSFSKHGALKLTSGLNSKISAYLLEKEIKKIVTRSPASRKAYFYFSSDSVFRKKLKGNRHASLLSSTVNSIQSRCQKSFCLLHITGEKTAAKINQVLKGQDLSNYLVLNSADPELLDKSLQGKVQNINSYTRSYALSSQVQKLLEKKAKALKKVVLNQ